MRFILTLGGHVSWRWRPTGPRVNFLWPRRSIIWRSGDSKRGEVKEEHEKCEGFRTIMERDMTPETKAVLCVEIVGARELLSSNIWGQVNPVVSVRMGATEATTAPQEGVTDPVWGEKFYFQHNPAASLEIVVRDKQFMGSEDIGFVRASVEDVSKGLRAAWLRGEQTWRTYFSLLGGEESSEAHKPGSHDLANGIGAADDARDRGGGGGQEWQPPKTSIPIGMYGTRTVELPKARGRLYVTFSLVEWHYETAMDTHTMILPQPLVWPPEGGAEDVREQRRLREQRWAVDEKGKGGVFRMLALDGGGVRGVLTAALLERLCKAFPKLMSEVDVVCGTSTGGLLALLLAAGYSPEMAKSIYRYHMPYVFSTTPARRYSLFKASYAKKGLQDLTSVYLNSRTLNDLQKHVIVTSFKVQGDSDAAPVADPALTGPPPKPLKKSSGKQEAPNAARRWQPAVFCNIPQGRGALPPDMDMLAMEAALRTSAAPTFFPLHNGFADGAIFANNPSLVGVAKVKACFPMLKTMDLRVLSIGTGGYPYSIDVQGESDADWGLRQWGPYLVDMLSDASSVNVDMNLRLLLGANYHRLDPPLPWKIALDNVDALDELIQLSQDADLSETEEFLAGNWASPAPVPFKSPSY